MLYFPFFLPTTLPLSGGHLHPDSLRLKLRNEAVLTGEWEADWNIRKAALTSLVLFFCVVLISIQIGRVGAEGCEENRRVFSELFLLQVE